MNTTRRGCLRTATHFSLRKSRTTNQVSASSIRSGVGSRARKSPKMSRGLQNPMRSLNLYSSRRFHSISARSTPSRPCTQAYHTTSHFTTSTVFVGNSILVSLLLLSPSCHATASTPFTKTAQDLRGRARYIFMMVPFYKSRSSAAS